MLEPVSGLIDDPELFMKAADEIEDNIRSFPEWMGVEDCCELGAHTTICLLEWTWGTMERKEMSTQQFLERVLKLDNDATYLHLNKEASLDFFAGLPENVRARVYADLSRANFAPKRDDCIPYGTRFIIGTSRNSILRLTFVRARNIWQATGATANR